MHGIVQFVLIAHQILSDPAADCIISATLILLYEYKFFPRASHIFKKSPGISA